MIQNAKLFGLTHKEQIITSAVAGWHNGVSKNYFKSRFYDGAIVKGKGSYQLPGWAGGKVKITVNMSNDSKMTVKFEKVG